MEMPVESGILRLLLCIAFPLGCLSVAFRGDWHFCFTQRRNLPWLRKHLGECCLAEDRFRRL